MTTPKITKEMAENFVTAIKEADQDNDGYLTDWLNEHGRPINSFAWLILFRAVADALEEE